MRIPYIEFTIDEPVRKLVVVDGLPFYFSTGENSGLKGLPMPFLMMRGNIKKPSFVGVPEIFKISMLERLFRQQIDYSYSLVKLMPELLTSSALDLPSGGGQKDDSSTIYIQTRVLDGKEEKIESNPLDDFIRKRIPTKKCLIISARLNLGSSDKDFKYSPALLKELGLDEKEIEEASQPLYLEDNPVKIFNITWADEKKDISHKEEACFDSEKIIMVDCSEYQKKLAEANSQINEINKWLAGQGGQVAHAVTKKPDFDICQTIWEKVEDKDKTKSSPLLGEEPLSVLRAKKILTDYYTKGSCCNRFWSGHMSRKHVREVNTVLRKKHDSIEKLLQSLKYELRAKKINEGPLTNCIDFLEKNPLAYPGKVCRSRALQTP